MCTASEEGPAFLFEFKLSEVSFIQEISFKILCDVINVGHHIGTGETVRRDFFVLLEVKKGK
jgi:hypothetical protein